MNRVSFVDAAVVDAEATAGLARECVVVTRAYTLARWVGEGSRPVTAGQVLLCVAFKEDPEDPVPFDLAGVNRGLALMGRNDW